MAKNLAAQLCDLIRLLFVTGREIAELIQNPGSNSIYYHVTPFLICCDNL